MVALLGVLNFLLLCGTAEAEGLAANSLRGATYDGMFEFSYEPWPSSREGSWHILVKSHLKHTWSFPTFKLKLAGVDEVTGMQTERVIDLESVCILEPEKDCAMTRSFDLPTKLRIQSAAVELVGGTRQPSREELYAQAEIAIQIDRKERAKKQAEREAEHEIDLAEEKRLRAVCRRLYFQTSNKRVSDLTVSQTQRVQACTSVGYYER